MGPPVLLGSLYSYWRLSLEYLLILKENTFKTIDSHNRVVNIIKVKRFKPFDGKEKMGSARIYNWSRTIPLLKDTLLVGFGPDTFSKVFPQNDFFGFENSTDVMIAFFE